MNEKTKTQLETAIEECAVRASRAGTASDALHFTQAALNAAQTLNILAILAITTKDT